MHGGSGLLEQDASQILVAPIIAFLYDYLGGHDDLDGAGRCLEWLMGSLQKDIVGPMQEPPSQDSISPKQQPIACVCAGHRAKIQTSYPLLL